MATRRRRQKLDGLSASQVRDWLGVYVLILTFVVGAWLLLARGKLLPLRDSDRTAGAEILLPFLLGQVSAVFRYYSGHHHAPDPPLSLPSWVVKLPPILVTFLLAGTFAMLGLQGFGKWEAGQDGGELLKGVLAFSVALLNATTVYVMSAYFEARGKQQAAAQPVVTNRVP